MNPTPSVSEGRARSCKYKSFEIRKNLHNKCPEAAVTSVLLLFWQNFISLCFNRSLMKNKMSVFVLICKSVNFLEISVSGQEIEILSFSMDIFRFENK